MKPIPVAVLGATGSVGQRFVSLLDGHPWFKVVALAGSDRSNGSPYATACRWILPEAMPDWARNMHLRPAIPSQVEAAIVFSALPSDQAEQIEPEFARAGMGVFSNASAYRKADDVPLLLPEINADHLQLVVQQRRLRGWSGSIVTNPNCTSTGMTVALGALRAKFGLRRAFVVSMQAISGAGYPGVPALDIMENVIPNIGGEEDKVEWEPRKMLGSRTEAGVQLADMLISAHTNRVPVIDGHMVCVSAEFDQPPSPHEAAATLRDYQAPEAARELPSSPRPVIKVLDEPYRPQPRLDRMTGKGMTTVVGRLRPDPLFHLKFVVLSHNTIRGAAGGSIYNAELMVATGLI